MKAASPLILILTGIIAQASQNSEAPAKRSPKEALQALNDLIGSWKGTGVPIGSREDKQRGFWIETISWSWHFKGNDAWLKVDFAKGKYFQAGELRYLPDQDGYQLTLRTVAKESQTFTGKIKQRVLTLEREAPGETQRLVINMLHANRFLYQYEVKPQAKTLFSRRYQVGATKEGVAFAGGDGRPECIVSGGLGTMPVSYKGSTYYVCCSGCRDEFNENPEKYVREFEAKKKKK
jgi:hypothetical protein